MTGRLDWVGASIGGCHVWATLWKKNVSTYFICIHHLYNKCSKNSRPSVIREYKYFLLKPLEKKEIILNCMIFFFIFQQSLPTLRNGIQNNTYILHIKHFISQHDSIILYQTQRKFHAYYRLKSFLGFGCTSIYPFSGKVTSHKYKM